MSTLSDVEVRPSERAVRELPRKVESKTRRITRARRTPTDWSTILMIGSCCLFAVAFAVYILYPAAITLVNSSLSTWSQGF